MSTEALERYGLDEGFQHSSGRSKLHKIEPQGCGGEAPDHALNSLFCSSLGRFQTLCGETIRLDWPHGKIAETQFTSGLCSRKFQIHSGTLALKTEDLVKSIGRFSKTQNGFAKTMPWTKNAGKIRRRAF